MIKWLSIVMVLILLFSTSLMADEVEDKISAALSLYQNGKTEECITSLAEAIMVMQNKKELKINKVELCTSVRGYGDYTTLGADTLKSGDPLFVYIEIEGFNVVKDQGKYWLWVSEDLTMTNEKGEVLVNKKDWMKEKKSYPFPVFPLYIPNKVTNIQAGKYKYEITIKDHLKKSFVVKAFEFEVKADQAPK